MLFIRGDQLVSNDIFLLMLFSFGLILKEWNYEIYDEKYNVWPARKYIGDSARYFIQEFHIDGNEI